jgi:hypothetical protein
MTRTLGILSIALCALVTSRASAALMHADVMSDTVNFTSIEEDSATGDPLPLFGQPVHSGGDTIDFPTTSAFSAVATDGGSDQTDGRLSMMVTAKPGRFITDIHFSEAGLATLFATNDDPSAAVTGVVDIDVFEVDGAVIPMINLPPVQFTYSPSNGVYQHSVNANGPLFSTGWTGSASADISAALNAAGQAFNLGATKLVVTIDNLLLAQTLAMGSSAFIDKKDFDITVDTIIPEPTTAMLGLVSLAFCGFCTRRRYAL